jgi:hypothetical protein
MGLVTGRDALLRVPVARERDPPKRGNEGGQSGSGGGARRDSR